MPSLDVAKRVIVVGIPGVGKSTIVNKTVDLLKKQGVTAKSVIFGSVMFDLGYFFQHA